MDEINNNLRVHEAEVELKIHEHKEENIINNTWKSCCFTLDKRSTIFFSTYSMSLILVFFCIFKLSGNLSCAEQNTWVGLMTMVIGIYMRAPTF
jgi:hypothetical protein